MRVTIHIPKSVPIDERNDLILKANDWIKNNCVFLQNTITATQSVFNNGAEAIIDVCNDELEAERYPQKA